jgi:hypothetical protein
MSIVIPLSTITAPGNLIQISNAGIIIIDAVSTGRNYSFSSLCLTLLNVNALAGGPVTLLGQLGTQTVSGGVFKAIQSFGFNASATAAGSINIGIPIDRSWPSALIMPSGSELIVNTTNFTNMTHANIFVDIAGFAF